MSAGMGNVTQHGNNTDLLTEVLNCLLEEFPPKINTDDVHDIRAQSY